MRRRKKDNLVLLLLFLLISMSLGYALIQADLSINGTSKINATSWNVYFDHIQVTSGSVTLSEGDSLPTINPTTLTDLTYAVTLKNPGDFYEFTVDVKNTGTLDAMIGEISSKLNNVEITTLPAYMNYSVTYSDETPIAPNHLLEKNTTETLKIRISYRTDIDSTDLPTIPTTNTFSFGISYIQKTNSAIPVPHPIVIYTANMYDYNDEENTTVRIGQPIPAAITQYSSAADAIAALNTQAGVPMLYPTYLKHFVSNDIVIKSYVEFIVTPEMAIENPTMTAGTYALRGADIYDANYNCKVEHWDSTTENCLNPYYATNVATLQAAFGVSNCTFASSTGEDYDCFITNLYTRASSFGNSYAQGIIECDIDADGRSSCIIVGDQS